MENQKNLKLEEFGRLKDLKLFFETFESEVDVESFIFNCGIKFLQMDVFVNGFENSFIANEFTKKYLDE